jgi:hypothetical protein
MEMLMQPTNIKIVASPKMVRLVIDDNIKHEDDIIDYEALFLHLGQAIPQATFHYEWTADLAQYDQDTSDTFTVVPGEVIETSTDIQVVSDDE